MDIQELDSKTPSRLLLECEEFKSLGSEMNPFECQFQYEPSPSSSSSTTTSTGLQNSPPTKPPPPPPPPHAQTLTFVVHDGKKKKRKNPGVTKRRIVFDGEDDQRKKFLERNRIAAHKCRQKKKKFIEDLEKRCEDAMKLNAELQALIAKLREESLFLRSQLLTHDDCNCSVVQTYLKRTSAQLTLTQRQEQPVNLLPIQQEELDYFAPKHCHASVAPLPSSPSQI